jgi:hypothetical protein
MKQGIGIMAKEESRAVALISEERKQQLALMDSFGKRQSTKSVIIGERLKFEKGRWLSGPRNNETAVPLGTKLVFNLDSVIIGWQRWEDGKVVDADMGLVIEGFQKKPRETLGSSDKSAWPEDNNGNKKDPWQYANISLLKEPGKKGQVYTLAVSSRGGLSAMGELMQKTVEGMRERGDGVLPVIALGTGGYKHKTFGWVDTPAFKIIGWVPASDFDVPLVARADEDGADFGEAETGVEETASEPKKPKATAKQTAAGKAKGKAGNGKRDISYE